MSGANSKARGDTGEAFSPITIPDCAVTNPVTRHASDTTVTTQQLAEVVGTQVDYLKTLRPLGV